MAKLEVNLVGYANAFNLEGLYTPSTISIRNPFVKSHCIFDVQNSRVVIGMFYDTLVCVG